MGQDSSQAAVGQGDQFKEGVKGAVFDDASSKRALLELSRLGSSDSHAEAVRRPWRAHGMNEI